MYNNNGDFVWPDLATQLEGNKAYLYWPKWQDLDKGRLQEVADDMAQLHTDDTFMHHFSLLNELKRQTQAGWENELIDDFDDYDTVPRDYRNRICIDDATPADWDALADKRLKARGVDTPQERSLKEMVENAEALGLYDDPPEPPLSQQIGGEHYRQGDIQPIEYIHANDMDFFSGNVVKYITRWRYKNGLEDLKKAKHYIELLMEQEYGYNG